MSMFASKPQPNVQESFEAFYEGWLARHESFLQQLLSVTPNDDDAEQRMLIEQVMCHYQQFLEEKSNVANGDVFLLFSPPWLSAYERSLLWIGDYKPSLILRLADGAVTGLMAEQREKMERVRDETKRAEREVSEAMAAVQESMASPRMLALVRVVDGVKTEQEAALQVLKDALKKVSERGDELRASTMRKVVEILSPPQTVQLLVATLRFQMRVRKNGLHRDEVGPSC
ncbi:transcription factor TGA [Vigna unguiculata]|uniref:Transcription factor TGA n=1 Tax=Vigna unguiculata TaxID=3917 RepID=A0A4D6NU17_VIGUN|nr:transcription factor TGA [Vigna unguiculata]